MIKFFLPGSCLLLLLTGCISFKTSGLKNMGEKKISNTEISPLFAHREPLLYKVSVDVLNKHYSGMLFLKQTDSATSHLVMITEVGIKLFEFEVRNESFNLVYCFPAINKPKIIRRLKEDFSMILQNEWQNKNSVIFLSEKNNEIIYRIKSGKRNYLCYVKRNLNQLEKVERYGKFARRSKVSFSDYENGVPKHILLKHSMIKFRIELNKLDRTADE